MGMYVSRLRSVPGSGFSYYAYLVDASNADAHSKVVDRFFDGFAKQSGVNAVIVRGPDDLSDELFTFLQSHAPGDFGRLETLFHEATCLIVAEGALQTTTKSVHVLPLLPGGEEVLEQSPLLDALLDLLLQAMREHRLTDFVQSLGAEKIELTKIKVGMLVATLRQLNEALELKSNVAGLGLNLNAIVQRFLGPSQRA